MRRKVISACVCVVIITGLIIIKNEYSRILLKKSTYGIPALVEYGEVENLFIGSSMFRQGLDINILEDEGEKDCYILAYNGNQPVTEAIILKDLIDNGVTIKNLYIDMYAYSASEKTKISDDKLFLEIGLREKKKLWESLDEKSVSKWWDMYIGANNEQLITWPISSSIVNSRFRKGGTLIESQGLDKAAYSNLKPPTTLTSLDKRQKDAIKELIEVCDRHDIFITFVDTPKSKCVALDENYICLMNEYVGLLDNEGVPYIIQGIQYDFDSENSMYYADAVHLSSEGREQFTKKMLEMLE